ncbi:hypothetical protein D3C73_1046710 [compost metagenome]
MSVGGWFNFKNPEAAVQLKLAGCLVHGYCFLQGLFIKFVVHCKQSTRRTGLFPFAVGLNGEGNQPFRRGIAHLAECAAAVLPHAVEAVRAALAAMVITGLLRGFDNPLQIIINIAVHVLVGNNIDRCESDQHHHRDGHQVDDQEAVSELFEH